LNFERVTEVFPRANSAWLREIEARAPRYGIDSLNETASFLSQFGHETAGFTRFEENLNYSAERLMKVWPRRFPDLVTANLYAHNPKDLAEKVYGGRMGNDQPGDGYRFRGRGAQVTGKNNYRRAALLTGFDLVAFPHRMLEPKIGVMVACAGWKASGLDQHDDDSNAREETFIVNGGEIGLRERQELLDKLLKVLA
jgi:putative chitinase